MSSPLAAITEKEASVASDQNAVRSVPGYKTGRRRAGHAGGPPLAPSPRLADAHSTDTEVALIPITDREGRPTRQRGRMRPLVSLSRGAALPRYVLSIVLLPGLLLSRDVRDQVGRSAGTRHGKKG